MKKSIAALAIAGLFTTGCVYDRGYDRRNQYPAQHREHRDEERQPVRRYEPVRQPEREDQRDRDSTQRRDSGEQRRDQKRDSDEQRREEKD